MRKPLKRKVLISLIFFLFINILIIFSFNMGLNYNIDENPINTHNNPKVSYYNTSFSPIYINGAASGIGAHNWDWAVSKPWCKLVNGVYIIENLIINNLDQENCILIENSNVLFTIRNCSVLSSGAANAGLKLKNTNNSIITNNNFSSKSIGIYLEESHFNTVSNNTAFYNHDFGILLNSSSHDNTIIGNNIRYNGNNGIRFLFGCKRNIITENSIKNNTQYGIYIHSSIDKSRYNSFFLNNLSGNKDNARDYGQDNSWDDGTFGNYWGDYDGSDTDGNGIGDAPYDIYQGSQDNYPLMAYWTPPKPPEPPGEFHFTSIMENPDKDGIFNLTWTDSIGANNYSLFYDDNQIMKIDWSVEIIAYQNATSPFLITGLITGEYYFVVVSYNESGETLSNNQHVIVQIPGEEPLPDEDDDKNNDNGNIFNMSGLAITIFIVLLSISTVAFLGIMNTHKIKLRNNSFTTLEVKGINIKAKTDLRPTSNTEDQEKFPSYKKDKNESYIEVSNENKNNLQSLFEKETGKHAIWRGKITNGYLEWKEKRDKKANLASQHASLNELSLQRKFEEETGKHAIWRGKNTKGYLLWKEKKKIRNRKKLSNSRK